MANKRLQTATPLSTANPYRNPRSPNPGRGSTAVAFRGAQLQAKKDQPRTYQPKLLSSSSPPLAKSFDFRSIRRSNYGDIHSSEALPPRLASP